MHPSICLIQPSRPRLYSPVFEKRSRGSNFHLQKSAGHAQLSYETNISEIFLCLSRSPVSMNLMGPDMMVILLIVLLLFGAKKLPELARGMGRAVKEFAAARDEVEWVLSQSG